MKASQTEKGRDWSEKRAQGMNGRENGKERNREISMWTQGKFRKRKHKSGELPLVPLKTVVMSSR